MSIQRWFGLIVILLVLVVGSSAVFAQERTESHFDGFLDRDIPSKAYPIPLNAGQAILIVTEATSGDLDTVVSIFDPSGNLVARNDDRNDNSYDSAVGYVAQSTGTFKVEVTRYPDSDTSGHYSLRIVVGDESILDELATLTRIQLSGATQILETPNFRIHYTFEGNDAVLSQEYVEYVGQAAEEAWQTEVVQMGWPIPPNDGVLGGDARFDIYLQDLLGAGEEALGYTVPDVVVGDNPNTPAVETAAAGSFLVLENDFADAQEEGSATPFTLAHTTIAHELNHALQFGFDSADLHNWMYEATATWMETAVAGKDQDATGYVYDAFQYPELCFGTINDPGEGAVQYGEWIFIQMMVDELGPDAVVRYWEQIAALDGWAALEQAIAPSGMDLASFVAKYRLKNLARDYTLAPLFEATVWQEATVDGVGRYTFTGEGIQELGANYFRFAPPPGAYYAGLVNDDGSLELWAIGINGTDVEAISLGRGGVFDTSPYTSAYLMVFNPIYDDDMTDCVYRDYQIDVQQSKSPAAGIVYRFPSIHYETLVEGN